MKVDIDENLLSQISKITDGKYFRATNNTRLRQIYQEIDKLEKSKIDITEFHKKNEEYLPLAWIALILLRDRRWCYGTPTSGTLLKNLKIWKLKIWK